MKLPDPKKPIQTTVSPWEVAFGQKVDADRLIQEDKEWLESRQRLMDARKRDDAKLLAQAEKARLNAPELKAAPSRLESTLSDIGRGLASAFKEGVPHEVGNLINTLQGKPIVESEYKRQPGVFQEEIERSWPEAIANAVVDPTNLVGMELLSPLAKLAKKAVAPALMVGSAAYAGDAEAGGLQKMLQMMYRGRSSFTPIEERAMFMSPTPRYAEEYAKRRVGQIGGDRMVDSYLVDPFGVERRGHNITPEGGGNLQSIIAYPKTGEAEYMGSRKFAKGGLARLASRLAADSAPARRGVADVVKEKGGNWLSGSVENSLSGLKKNPPFKPPSYEYMREQAVENGRRNYSANDYQEYLDIVAPTMNPKWTPEESAINNWIDKQLTKYVRNDMATPGDPIRALAEKGIIHQERLTPSQFGPERARRQGYPNANVLGQSDLARKWEDVSDQAIQTNKAFDLRDKTFYTDPEYYDKQISDNSWLNKVPGETPVYAPDGGYTASNLGFDHLIDELSNAINPESGLPRHLQFPADRLDRVSVPQAVERVSEINVWRKALKVEEDLKRANNAATVLHKEYPDKGMKWVELKSPDRWPENIDPVKKEEFGDLGRYSRSALSDALKYEGDTMGHCVGGYCDDVASGRSRIYSLRDAKGSPHTTIEVAPGKVTREYLESLPDPDNPDKFEPDVLGVRNTFRDYVQRHRSGNGDFDEFALKALQELGHQLPPQRIVQIKGKGNAKPIDEYLPFVQDFVRSGQWSDVGDLQNSGLTKVGDRFVSDAEAAALAERHFGGKWGNKPDADENPFQYFNRINRYDENMLSDADRAFIADWKAGNFAHGGSIQAKPVKTVQDIQAIINSLSERQFHA